ncbi:MAG: hypothetical protein ACRDPT_11655 [Streptomycetales bacterium]
MSEMETTQTADMIENSSSDTSAVDEEFGIEAPEADAIEQHRVVELDEDDYR